MKKSSTRSSSVEKGQIDSAFRTACDENDARVAATLFGDVGDENEPPPGDSNLRFLMASACRFGGPLRLLGLSKVQGISNAAHALQGGPDSSHCQMLALFCRIPISFDQPSLCGCCKNHKPCASDCPSVLRHHCHS